MEKYERTDSVANRLREAMYKAEKTQADLSRETGISKATLSRYLSGQFEPKQIAVNKMAVALNVAEMWLWGCDVPMERINPTEMQQKNDTLSDIVIRLRTDDVFMEAVESLYEMDSDKLSSLLAFLK